MFQLNNRNIFYASVVIVYLCLIYNCQKDLNMCIGISVIALAVLHFGGQCVHLTERFSNYSDNSDEGKMGPYDGLVLQSPENKHSLHSPENVYTLFGTPTSLEDKTSVYDSVDRTSFPSVDGTDNSPKSLFAYAFNKSSPECCPSTYSTDMGCVCQTPDQNKYINQRGGNRRGLLTEF